MQLIKQLQSCVRLESEHGTIVFDPSVWQDAAVYDGADAVLITHEHQDHFDPEKLSAALRADETLVVLAPASAAGQLGDLAGRVTVVEPGQTHRVAGFEVRTFGGEHAVIHPDVNHPRNVAYLVDGVYHPGDSFTVPDAPVRELLLPISGPWMKFSEAVDFARAVNAPRSLPIHDVLHSEIGVGLAQRFIGSMIPGQYQDLRPGDSIEV